LHAEETRVGLDTIEAEDRAAMEDSFRRLLADRGAEADVRRVMETPEGFDRELWRAIADLGVAGLLIEPEYGGLGAGPVEMERLMEIAGAALLCGPLFSSGVLAATLLGLSSDQAAKARLLPKIASGETICTVALTGDAGLWTPDEVNVTASPEGGAFSLSGVASFVTSGQIADVLLVIAEGPDGRGAYELDAATPGVVVTPLETLDMTQRLARIEFDNAVAAKLSGVGPAEIQRVLQTGLVALSGDHAGAARRIFDITLDYIKMRVQFGRPVGGFQALKHMAADILIDVESAISAARNAARALASDDARKDAAISLAAFSCADGFMHAAHNALQMHGGIGFTWANPVHLYLRHARAGVQLFGSSDAHRDRYVAAFENSL